MLKKRYISTIFKKGKRLQFLKSWGEESLQRTCEKKAAGKQVEKTGLGGGGA